MAKQVRTRYHKVNMADRISIKTIYILIAIFLFAALAVIGGVRTYFHWTNTQYFGEVVEIQETRFVIKTGDDSRILIGTGKNTEIRKGKKIWTEKLHMGDYVIVVGSPNQEGFIEAQVIRIVAPPRPPKL